MNELKKETWQELKNMVEKASAAYIAAVAEDGFPSIKAVFAAKGSDGMKTFWFSTNLSAQRTQLFIKNPKACVYFCDPERFLALSMKGNIRVRTDREARERIWEDGDEQYYTEGIDDPDYCVLEFSPVGGRFFCGREEFYKGDLAEEDFQE